MNTRALEAAFKLATSLPVRFHPRREERPTVDKRPRNYWRDMKRKERARKAA